MVIIPTAESFADRVDLRLLVGPQGPDRHTFLVCSKSLSQASPVLEALVQERTDSRPDHIGQRTIDLSADDPESVRIILNIAHGYPQKVPKRINPESLYRLCGCIHKYEIGEILSPWVGDWRRAAQRPQEWVPQTCGSYAEAVWIGWVLGSKTVISSAAKAMLLNLDSASLAELKKQDPTGIVGHIAELQAQAVQALVDTIASYWNTLLDSHATKSRCQVGFTHEGRCRCDALVLGSFTGSLYLEGLLKPEAYQQTHKLGHLGRAGERIAGKIAAIRGAGHRDCGPGPQLLESMHRVMKNIGPLLPEEVSKHLEGRAEKLGVKQ
ncbi:hypothetical protein RB595_007110 [Gaeumannomyces hyphopodioides]